MSKRAVFISVLLGCLVGGVLGGMIGSLWHAPGSPSTWADVRDWLSTAAIVLGLPALLYQLSLQRRQFVDDNKRNLARDKLLDRQLSDLAARERSKVREQAECIDVTWSDLESGSLVTVINESRRPITSVSCVINFDEREETQVEAQYCAEMLPVSGPPPGWAMPAKPGHPVTELVALRAGGRAGFVFQIDKPDGDSTGAYVNFYDDAMTYWLLSSNLELEPGEVS